MEKEIELPCVTAGEDATHFRFNYYNGRDRPSDLIIRNVTTYPGQAVILDVKNIMKLLKFLHDAMKYDMENKIKK